MSSRGVHIVNGIIRSYVPTKNYGFIKGQDGKDYFFHLQDLEDRSQGSLVAEGLAVEFDPEPTPKGYKALSWRIIRPSEVRYKEPDCVLLSKCEEIPGWVILDKSRWIIHGSASGSPDNAKQSLKARAMAIGANAVLSMTYYKTTGAEPSNAGSGTHYFTIHNFRGIAAFAGKPHVRGDINLEEVKGRIDKKARYLKREFEKKNRKRKRISVLVWLVVLPFTAFFGLGWWVDGLKEHPEWALFTIVGLVLIFKYGRPRRIGEWLVQSG
ncbi:MAG TPA: cold shock domain-containing protein [Gammaproteobacteria bacterium]|nr:cold shock domain-containing protein [Gammaproteobacteria bacterium]